MEKSVLKSKTFYLGLVTALAPLFPVIGEFVAANLELVGIVWGGLAVVIRFFTKDKIKLIN